MDYLTIELESGFYSDISKDWPLGWNLDISDRRVGSYSELRYMLGVI